MDVDSQMQSLPPLFENPAISPPPSFPLLPSDAFTFSDFDINDLEGLENFTDLFDTSRPYQPPRATEQPSEQPAQQPLVRLFSSPPTAPSSTRPPVPTWPAPSLESFSTQPTEIPGNPLHTSDTSQSVDLTILSSPPTMAPPRRKRPAPARDASPSRSESKRMKPSPPNLKQEDGTGVEVIDRVDMCDDGDAGTALRQKQKEEQVKALRKEAPEGTRMSSLTCIICLEPPSDMTVTKCGHLFCHACLMAALLASETSKSKCPVCRSVVSRTKKNTRGTFADYQPLELKVSTKSRKGQRSAAK